MDRINLEKQIQKLKEIEEKELAQIRRKILEEEENAKKEAERREAEEEVHKLEKTIEETDAKLEESKKKMLQLQIEAAAWEEVARHKAEELRSMEEDLNLKHEAIWRKRDEFCDQVDDFIREYELLHKTVATTQQNIDPTGDDEIEGEIYKLKASIMEEQEREVSLKRRLDELMREKENHTTEICQEIKRLEDCLQITRNRCAELKHRIRDKKGSTSVDEARDNSRSGLFSMLDLATVKKLSNCKI